MKHFPEFAMHKEHICVRLGSVLCATAVLFGSLVIPASARTLYKIHDGDQVVSHISYSNDISTVLDEAGVELGANDTYVTHEGEDFDSIIVHRVQMITILNGTELVKTGTYGETVGSLLSRLEIVPDDNDTVSVAMDQETYDGMEIQVVYREVLQETFNEVIPFETEYVDDDRLMVGREKVRVEGRDGEQMIVEEVVYENGVEVSRVRVATETVTEVVNQVIGVGTVEEQANKYGSVTAGGGYITTSSGEVLTYSHTMQARATAYTCEGWSKPGITATGTVARVGAIAVDPKVIPYGTRMFIVTNDGQYIYGFATAEDTGHPDFIRGNRIDLYMNTYNECIQFGVRDCTIYFLD